MKEKHRRFSCVTDTKTLSHHINHNAPTHAPRKRKIKIASTSPVIYLMFVLVIKFVKKWSDKLNSTRRSPKGVQQNMNGFAEFPRLSFWDAKLVSRLSMRVQKPHAWRDNFRSR